MNTKSKRKSKARAKNPTAKKGNGVHIDCAYDDLVDTDTLIPNPRNPNRHPPQQIELLAKIIKTQGFRRVVVVSRRSGFVTVGHARLEAAKRLLMPKVPVDYQDYPDEAHEWADMIADNRLAELADTSLPDLKDMLQELDTGAFDMDLTGFDTEALEALMTQFWPNEDGLPSDLPDPTIAGADDRLHRFILIWGDDVQKDYIQRLLGIDGKKTVYTVGEIQDARANEAAS